jgi:hypothetical protein
MFRVGQEIVAIRNHSRGSFKKGDTFIVKGIQAPSCSHSDALVNIGISKGVYVGGICPNCGIKTPSSYYCWYSCFSFRAIETTYTESEIESVDISEITQEEVITV